MVGLEEGWLTEELGSCFVVVVVGDEKRKRKKRGEQTAFILLCFAGNCFLIECHATVRAWTILAASSFCVIVIII